MADETPDERNQRLIEAVVERARELVDLWDTDQSHDMVGDGLLAVNQALLDLLTANEPEGEGDGEAASTP